ncbi:hypothetical protein [Micromonospora peucetia]|uniref:Competence protein CoiA-like family protein n=1 Tax=Micromonospora peucetia TaxID=47871 RepID=A0A1C6TUX9_9ACTN|nr:hypothetical protein [Micromonospora peucetia]SCL45585.1 hypothetical protein GA0070608_0030 [Micromonospora peucetia]
MTFVALHADRGRVDATLDDLGCGWVWSEIHRRRPRVRLCCQQCDHPVHAKVSSGGLRFFAHDPERRPDCPAARETMEHHRACDAASFRGFSEGLVRTPAKRARVSGLSG